MRFVLSYVDNPFTVLRDFAVVDAGDAAEALREAGRRMPAATVLAAQAIDPPSGYRFADRVGDMIVPRED